MSDRTATVVATFQQLSELGVPKTRIAKQLGIARQTLEYHLKKQKGAGSPTPDTGHLTNQAEQHLTEPTVPDSLTTPATGN